MGMYTELVFNARVVNLDLPALNALKEMVGNLDDPPDENYTHPDHDFFKCKRWKWVGTGTSSSFQHDANSYLNPTYKVNGKVAHNLSIQCSFKNTYEVTEFLKWISPYVDHEYESFFGYTRYEESEIPWLIMWDAEKEELVKVVISIDFIADDYSEYRSEWA